MNHSDLSFHWLISQLSVCEKSQRKTEWKREKVRIQDPLTLLRIIVNEANERTLNEFIYLLGL